MVKLTSFLLAAATVLVSTNAQALLTPRSISLADYDLALSDATLSGPHNTILRRADPVKKPKKTAVLTKEQQTILDTHNKYRARHQAPPLTWDATVAASAAAAIAPCEFKHSGSKYGENLAAGYQNFKAGIDAWYNEVKFYNYNNPGFAMNTGHFTQVVWKSTKAIGCAKKKCPKWTIYNCQYKAAGNIVDSTGSYFRKNVLKPVKAAKKQ
ncbi:hypothetical protein BGX34_009971 [Mortierella sp. NVP85]|nr:hypothetical protein BGX34_009971 [Mortierella sp. NVP85]